MRVAGLAAIGLLVLLSGCAEDTSPQGECARRAYDDPTVREYIAQGAGTPALQEANADALKRAKAAATNRCLQARGLIRPGGVEQVVPPR